ncbi:DeoR/GlpR family DNA-binding transcription regulator [Salisediminibacterium beveridgei]|uniref:Transcriptional regulator, DeoR family n=1 Tax=Salisediminibacterium beveridgei TaxID=632773 RepID=A0A1D7QR90_9BACI|nr:DeoR/GlpR family DNA-binding transcription regulator [Salisediminibacterium beveridgei]AOM81529.1 transcriptional regulator, DeoR family [Salisediminibacterium beveridgei]
MLPVARRRWLETKVQDEGQIDIDAISELLKVSPMTIRRDLKELESNNKVIRTHGGAISPYSLTQEVPYSSKENKNVQLKKEIAQKALSLIQENSTIILDSGTTTFELAKLIKNLDALTIITNDIKIANELLYSKHNVIVIGGEMQNDIGALFGSAAEQMLNMIHADFLFLGAHAIKLEEGISAPTFGKSQIKKLMINAAATTWCLADHSKFDQYSFTKVCKLHELDGIISDNGISESTLTRYKESVDIL